MCSPTAAIAVASLVIADREKRANARRQEESLAAEQRNSDVQAQVEQNQINENAADNLTLRAKQALQERALLRVSSGEAGVAGNSVERVNSEADVNAGWDIARILTNTRNRVTQSRLEARGRNASIASRYNQIERPSTLSTGLQIAGSIYGDQN